MDKALESKTEERSFGFYFWRFMFYWFMISSIALMLVIYPQWLGWVKPMGFFGFVPIMTLMEWYVEIGFGISAYFWLEYYWPYRKDYSIEELK